MYLVILSFVPALGCSCEVGQYFWVICRSVRTQVHFVNLSTVAGDAVIQRYIMWWVSHLSHYFTLKRSHHSYWYSIYMYVVVTNLIAQPWLLVSLLFDVSWIKFFYCKSMVLLSVANTYTLGVSLNTCATGEMIFEVWRYLWKSVKKIIITAVSFLWKKIWRPIA